MSSRVNIPELLQLAAIPGIGSNRLRNLILHFKSTTEVLSATARDLVQVEGIDKKLATTIAHFNGGKVFVDEQLSRLNKINGRIITIWDDEYPSLLKKIYDPPVFLFIRGELRKEDNLSIAVVGTRHPTVYGKIITEQFAKEFSEKGITTVSGLARGIDTIAHTASLKAEGRTISIIGSAIDHIYPTENKKLAEHIEENGAVISEFFMGTKPDPGNFPRRNRIISGVSLGTVIIESAEDGGAMITGAIAIDQNRELFCVPGNVTEKYSRGTNKLIKLGQAKLVQQVDDILVELQHHLRPILKTPLEKPFPQLSVFEQKIFDILTYEPIHIDSISEKSSLSISDTLVNLLSLEFKGIIRQMAGKMFVKNI
jgi:DNA processing protein